MILIDDLDLFFMAFFFAMGFWCVIPLTISAIIISLLSKKKIIKNLLFCALIVSCTSGFIEIFLMLKLAGPWYKDIGSDRELGKLLGEIPPILSILIGISIQILIAKYSKKDIKSIVDDKEKEGIETTKVKKD